MSIARIGSSTLYTLLVDGHVHRVQLESAKDSYEVSVRGTRLVIGTSRPTRHRQSTVIDTPVISAPISGTIAHLHVQEGTRVDKGALLLDIQAMKMHNDILAPGAGVVRRVWIAEGSTVAAGQRLLEIQADLTPGD